MKDINLSGLLAGEYCQSCKSHRLSLTDDLMISCKDCCEEHSFAPILLVEYQTVCRDLSHAPVIDAEKLGYKIYHQYEYWKCGTIGKMPTPEEKQKLTALLITDSIDLNITWVDGKSRWGIFWLCAYKNKGQSHWGWYLDCGGDDLHGEGEAPTKEDCQQACEKALKGIVTGVRE